MIVSFLFFTLLARLNVFEAHALIRSPSPKPNSLLRQASLIELALLLRCMLRLRPSHLLDLRRLRTDAWTRSRSKSFSTSWCLGMSAAKTASSKTSLTPSPVRAEHSVYAVAFDCRLNDLRVPGLRSRRERDCAQPRRSVWQQGQQESLADDNSLQGSTSAQHCWLRQALQGCSKR